MNTGSAMRTVSADKKAWRFGLAVFAEEGVMLISDEADREDYLVRGRIQGVQASRAGVLQTRENRTLRRCPFAYRKEHEVSRQALSPERLAGKASLPTRWNIGIWPRSSPSLNGKPLSPIFHGQRFSLARRLGCSIIGALPRCQLYFICTGIAIIGSF